MVNGDISFYTVTGEEINRTILVQEMIDFFNEKYPNAFITDFNEGSVARNITESLSVDAYHIMKVDNDVERVAFLSTATGGYLDLHGADMNAPRNEGSQAWGTVTFSIPQTEAFVITIPENTILVSSETGLQFVTVLESVINVGEVSVDCPVRSVVVGDNTNAKAGTVNTFYDTKPYNALSVTNVEGFSGGKDSENDDTYRQRLLYLKQKDGFGSKQYYAGLGLEVEGVHDIMLVPSENNYTGKVIVNGDDKPLSDDILALVVSIYSDERNLVYEHSFEVVPVTYTTVDLEIEVSVSQEIAETEFTNALKRLFDGSTNSYKGMNINQALSKYLIITCIESDILGVYQVTNMTSNNQTFNKLTPTENTVLRLGNVTVTQNVED